MPPLLADFIHAGACIPICEKFLTRPGRKKQIQEYILHCIDIVRESAAYIPVKVRTFIDLMGDFTVLQISVR